jgi:hypothetical protein
MADISIGAAVGAGFGLIRRRPLSVLAWGAVRVGLQLAAFALLAPYYLGIYGSMLQGLANGAGPMAGLLSPQAQQMQQVQGLVQLVNLAQLLVSMVVYCAVFRAVLHPERSSFAYLRIGPPELFLVVLAFAAFIALFVGLLVITIPVAIVIGVTVAVTHGGSAAALALIPIVVLALLVAGVFVGLRFAFVGPMMVQDGKFHLFESWTATRGRVGSLFLIGLSLFGLLLLIDILLLAIVFALGAAAVQSLGGLSQVAAQLRASPQALIGRLAPLLAVYALLQIPIGGCLSAIAGAPWAKAYSDLQPGAAEHFA